MSTGRGSKHKLSMIQEVTYGTTPATPTLLELPINTFTPSIAETPIKSEQIRTHPFVDRIMQGAEVVDLSMTCELQKNNHDGLLQLMTGLAWATNATKMTDVLLSASIESGHTDLSLFDVYTGACVKQAQFNFPAAADAKVTAQFDLMAKAAAMDAGTTIATALTAATTPDPFVFKDATLTLGGSSRLVTAASLTVARQIDPLYVLGALQPNEYIPGAVTVTGQITIPLSSSAESTQLKAFTASALVITCTNTAGSFTFTVPLVNLGKMGRPIQSRGAILQTIDFEAKYDSSTSTVLSLART